MIFRRNKKLSKQPTSPSRLDFSKPWTTDMLAGGLEALIDQFGLDEDKGYLGDPRKFLFEIGFCPLCRTPMALANGCPHVAFCYDLKDTEYRYIRDDFRDLITARRTGPGIWPRPDELEKEFDGLQLSRIKYPVPIWGFIWGYVTKAGKRQGNWSQ